MIYGGRSGEHEVSVAAAAAVFKNLSRSLYEPVAIRIDKDGRWSLPDRPPAALAASEVIEQSRIVLTNGAGAYNIIDLRPGTYSLTFSTPGFQTYKREGLELPSDFTATIDVTPTCVKYSASGFDAMSSPCVCTSMKPGARTRPLTSSRSVDSLAATLPMRAIRPSRMPTSANRAGAPVPSTTRALTMARSKSGREGVCAETALKERTSASRKRRITPGSFFRSWR